MLKEIKLEAELESKDRRTTILWDDDSYALARELADEANLSLGETIHVTMLLTTLAATNARLTFQVKPDSPACDLELAAIVIARCSGLINDDELGVLVAFAEANPGKDVAHRLNVLFRRLSTVMERRDADFPERFAEYQRVINMTPEERLAYLDEVERQESEKDKR